MDRGCIKSKNIRKILIRIVFILLLGFMYIVNTYILPVHMYIEGNSMEPELHDGDTVLIVDYMISKKLNLYKGYTNLDYGDKIVMDISKFQLSVSNPFDVVNQKYSIKTILGKPNDTVSFNHTGVFINGNKNRYTNVFNTDDNIQLGAEDYFVVGLNETKSLDSRTYGPINHNQITHVFYDKCTKKGLHSHLLDIIPDLFK